MTTRHSLLAVKYLLATISFLIFSAVFASLSFAQSQNQNSKVSDTIKIGNVDRVTTDMLVLDETKTKQKIQASVDKSTKIIGQTKQISRLSDIKPDDLVVIISTSSATATASSTPKPATNSAQPSMVYKALRIFVKEATPSAPKREAVFGSVSDIGRSTFALTHPTKQENTYQVLVNSSTVYKSSETQTPRFLDIKAGQRLVVVAELQQNGSLLAKYIHLLPLQAGAPKTQPATSSASPSASNKTPTSTASGSNN